MAIKYVLVTSHRVILTPIKTLTPVATRASRRAPNDATNNPRAKEMLSGYVYVH